LALHPALQTVLYDEEYLAFAAHLLSLAPEDISSDGKHDAETWFYGGVFPAMVVRSNGYSDTPTEHASNQVPGEIDVIVEFMYPSIGSMAEPDGAAYASKLTLHLHSLWRSNLYNPLTTARTMDGKYSMISILSMDEGDRDQYGNVRAGDNDTDSILWVNRCNVRAYQ
jgi:hypothetical protein